MGWTTIDGLAYGETPDSFLRKEFEHDKLDANGDRHACLILKAAFVGSTWYAAARIVRPGKDYVLGVVVLTSRRGGFGWKEMSEDMGPYESHCPAGILAMLSPVEEIGGYAAEWRARCFANLAARRERTKRAAA